MPHRVATFIANVTTALMGLLGVEHPAQVYNLVISVIAIVWIIKTISGNSAKRKQKQAEEDWLYAAQKHQQSKYDYTDPVRATTTAKKHKETKYKKHGTVSPTGWILDEETGQWQPPKSLKREAKERWEWNEEKRIWIDKYKQK